jgi:hypothetical protein
MEFISAIFDDVVTGLAFLACAFFVLFFGFDFHLLGEVKEIFYKSQDFNSNLVFVIIVVCSWPIGLLIEIISDKKILGGRDEKIRIRIFESYSNELNKYLNRILFFDEGGNIEKIIKENEGKPEFISELYHRLRLFVYHESPQIKDQLDRIQMEIRILGPISIIGYFWLFIMILALLIRIFHITQGMNSGVLAPIIMTSVLIITGYCSVKGWDTQRERFYKTIIRAFLTVIRNKNE